MFPLFVRPLINSQYFSPEPISRARSHVQPDEELAPDVERGFYRGEEFIEFEGTNSTGYVFVCYSDSRNLKRLSHVN